MECALSGQNATHPVVSRHGHVFERDLILKHLEATGKCPITGEPMSPEELIEVKINTAVKPRPVTATHIPGLLQIFQNEWDAVMLETFTLKQQLDSTRQELANALYQHDAACRVIARLIRERDEARNALAQVAHYAPSSSSEDVNMESADRTITKEIQKKIQKLGQQLSKERKNRNVPSLPAESIQGFKQISTQNLHKTTKPGVLCVDIHPVDTNLIITGGADETAVIYNRQTKKKIDTLSGHSKQVLDVLFHPTETVAFTSSFDKTVRVWGQDASSGTMQTKHVISTHAGPVTAIDLHPLGNYLLSASQDRTWGFHDIHTGICLAQVSEASIENGFTTAMVHPDGNLFATGSGADVQIWDICNQKVAANLAQAHPGGISSLSFSENGFYFVTGGSDSLKLWDLRKLADPRVYNFESNFNLSSLSIDYSGKYLAAAGNEIRLFKTKTLEPIVALTNHSQTVTDVKWGRGDFLASTSLDRSLRIFGV